MNNFRGVWVFAEQKSGKIKNVSFELLGEANKLANDLKTDVSAVLFGHNTDKNVKELIAYGADKVYVVDNTNLKDFNDEIYYNLFAKLIEKYKPEIILFGATIHGRSLAPGLASRFNTGLTADCTKLKIDKEKKILKQTRPAFSGGLMATIVCENKRPQMATVRPKVMKKLNRDLTRDGRIIKPDVKITKSNTKVLEVVDMFFKDNNLHEAKIIVSVGRGIGSKENIKLAYELADALGGTVGASRAVVDAGWLDYSRQIGQTGITVSPDIYFALGISGAVQHLAGMLSSKKIVAVNKDKDAAIFNVAHYGIQGDLMDVIPKLIDKIKKG